jgi:hypothetical protein
MTKGVPIATHLCARLSIIVFYHHSVKNILSAEIQFLVFYHTLDITIRHANTSINSIEEKIS